MASDNREVYAVTRTHVFQYVEAEDFRSASLGWRADLSDAYKETSSPHNAGVLCVNALTPTVTANGVAVSVAAVRPAGKAHLLMQVPTRAGC